MVWFPALRLPQGSSEAPVTSGGRDLVVNGSPKGGRTAEPSKPPVASCERSGSSVTAEGSTNSKNSPSGDGVTIPLKLAATCTEHDLVAKPQRDKKVGRSGATKVAPKSEPKPSSASTPSSAAVSKSDGVRSGSRDDVRESSSQRAGVNGTSKDAGAVQPAAKPERRDESKPKLKPPLDESLRFSSLPTDEAPPVFPNYFPPHERDGRYLDGVAADATGWPAYQQPPWQAADPPFTPSLGGAPLPYAMPPQIAYPTCLPYQPIGLLWSPLLPVAYQPLPYQAPFAPLVPAPGYPGAYQPGYPDLYPGYAGGAPVHQYANSVPTTPYEQWGRNAPTAVPQASETVGVQTRDRRSADDHQNKQRADDSREPAADKGSGQNSSKS